MKRSELMAALEERLLFYRDLMRHLADAAREEDAEKIERYTELESIESGKIKALGKSIEGYPVSDDPVEKETSAVLRLRILSAARRAEEASSLARKLLAEHMTDLARRGAAARRGSSLREKSPPPPPSFIDLTV